MMSGQNLDIPCLEVLLLMVYNISVVETSENSAAREHACFGSKRPLVQIQLLRLAGVKPVD